MLNARRQALLKSVKKGPWEDLHFPLTRFSGYGVLSYDSASDSLHYTKDSASAYASANAQFSTQRGYEYMLECDAEVTSGTTCLAARKSNNRIVKSTPTTTGAAHLTMLFSHDPEISSLSILGSQASAELVDVTISNFIVRRRTV